MKAFYWIFLAPIFSFAVQGLEYSYMQFPTSDEFFLESEFQSIHLLEVDPTLYSIKPARALDDGLGRESVLSLSERNGAAASVNGGFFTIGGMFDGAPRGALKKDRWFAFPLKTRGAMAWSDDTPPFMDRIKVNLNGSYQDEIFSIDGLNRKREEGEMILYNPSFHRTSLTDPDGEEVIISNGTVISVVKGGSSKIPQNGYVLSIHKNHPLYNSFAIGASLIFTTTLVPQLDPTRLWEDENLQYILGGAPLLIHPKSLFLDFGQEKMSERFSSTRLARTAVGILPSGNWLFAVVDKTGYEDGMTLHELADLMKRLGCVQALNLDGGGSSTLVIEGVVKNSPRKDEDESEDSLRRVSDALVIVLKTQQE